MNKYTTTYCNKGHCVATGKPVGHECHVLPPSAIREEMAGNMEEAIRILQRSKPLRVHKGLRERLPLGEPTTVVSPMGQACPEGENMITKDTKGVAIHFVPLDEDMHPGGCIEDNELVLEILKESNDGNIFAWFCAKVWATYDGDISGEPVYLGGCSYESEADFKSSDYYHDMVDEAVANLSVRLSSLKSSLAELEL